MSHEHEHQCGCGCGHHGGRVDEPSRDWTQAADDETVCYCHGVSKAVLVEAIRQGAYTVPLLKTMTGAGRGKQCKQRHPLGRGCEADLDELVRLYGGPRPVGAPSGSCHH